MATEVKAVIDAFFNKAEEDPTFFRYFNLPPGEALALADERARIFLKEAVAKLEMTCHPDVDFSDIDEYLDAWNFDLTHVEIQLISDLMLEQLMVRGLRRVQVLERNYVPKDLNVFSPSEDRKTYLAIYNQLHQQNISAMVDYANRDRETGALKTIDYTLSDDV